MTTIKLTKDLKSALTYVKRACCKDKDREVMQHVNVNGKLTVAPPSINERGSIYEWLINGLDSVPATFPIFLEDTLLQYNNNNIKASLSSTLDNNSTLVKKIGMGREYERGEGEDGTIHQCVTSITKRINRNITFDEGGRDESLFYLANPLVQSGMPIDNIKKYLHFFALNCKPPFPENEVEIKIKSALQRQENREKLSMNEIRDWVRITTGNFSVTNAEQSLTSVTNKSDRAKLRVYLNRLVAEGVLERATGRDGIFRRIENNLNVIDLKQKNPNEFKVKLPVVSPLGSGVTPEDAKQSFDDFTARLQIDFRPNDDLLWYASYNRGSKSGGFTFSTGTPFDPNQLTFLSGLVFEPETLNAYEIGLKSSLAGGTMMLNVAAFLYDYDDYQAFAQLGPVQTVLNQDAEATGLEIELNARPTDGLLLQLSGTLMDSEVKDILLPDTVTIVDHDLPQAPSFADRRRRRE